MKELTEYLDQRIEEIELKISKKIEENDYYEGQIDGIIIALRAIRNMEA